MAYNADMTTKDDLHRIIDGLTEEEADQFLDWINLKADPDELTPEEAADVARIRAEADYVPLESLRGGVGSATGEMTFRLRLSRDARIAPRGQVYRNL